VESKAENPAHLLADRQGHSLVTAYFELCQLKQLYRQGWLRRGVPKDRCESVAEHSFGVAVLGLWLAGSSYPGLDSNKVLRMALLHDFGEIYAGDIIPSDGVAPEEKHRLEEQSVETVLGRLPDGEIYMDAWREYEQGSSPEARLVRQLDRLEMGLQASVYAGQGFTGLEEFLASARQGLSDPLLVALLEEIESLPGAGS